MDPSGQPSPSQGQPSGQGTPPPGPQPPAPPPASWQSAPQPAAPPVTSTLPPGPVAGTTVADFTTRLIAYVIDSIGLAVVNFIVAQLVFAILPFSFIGSLLQIILVAAISAAYFIYFWTNRRATLGMQVMKIEVVNDGSGGAISQGQAITRWIYLALPGILAIAFFPAFGVSAIGLIGLGILTLLIAVAALAWELYLAYTTAQDPRKQGVHDKAARTVVIAVGSSPFGAR